MKRGIVSSQYEYSICNNGSAFEIKTGLGPLEMNYFALYWDKFVIPTTSFIRIELQKEKEFIEKDILYRPKIELTGSLSAITMEQQELKTQLNTVDLLRNQYKNIDWSLHFLNNIAFPSGESIQREVLRMELGQLLPVPDETVSLDSILEFKLKRADELESLHAYCDELYEEALISGDFNLARAKAFHKLEKCLEDLEKLNNEGWRSPIRFNMSFAPEFDMAQVGTAAVTAFAALQSPHPLAAVTAGSVATVLGGFVKIKPAIQSMRIGQGAPHMTYLSNARKEGIIT